MVLSHGAANEHWRVVCTAFIYRMTGKPRWIYCKFACQLVNLYQWYQVEWRQGTFRMAAQGNNGVLVKMEEESTPQEEFENQSLTDHLRDLRSCLIISFAAVFIGFCCTYTVIRPIGSWFFRPLVEVLPQGTSLIFTSYQEGFFFIWSSLLSVVFYWLLRLFFFKYGVLSRRDCSSMKKRYLYLLHYCRPSVLSAAPPLATL